ncbi:Stage III sporulation protein AB (spore_III_AB) [Clostridioides difficile]|uniref:stage III sporulation protein AB n=1 Tax=unclassified Clostridioides TaxID=2635829 RepID=UPI001D101975|nr:stage III sporulation protein AB [Clostridioides sp. ZZV14-6153]MCC0729151.1 stage III sporulation protein AB [Clostridioides sp. ZZV14-6048]MCC0734099.1 stage III sporulation protein AB [Clostridioides sp. ZZV14-6009]WLD27392.1 Stage III sporulation protein AB (spore_III_AB) [Clostridioides difficile]
MQIKIIIIALLIGSSYLIGEHIYKTYTRRHKQLNDLIRVLEILRMDLSFGLYTLEEIFRRIGCNKDFCFWGFFYQISEELHNEQSKTLEEIISENTEILVKETYLGSKEIEELKNLILTLGKSDIESQQRMIDLSIENLKKQTYETKEDISKKGLLYKKLVTFIGIGICIILI